MPFEKTLDLSQQTKPNLSDAEFTSIMQELKTDTTVTTLILSGMHFKQKRSEQLRDMLKENKTIEILDLSHCQTGYYCLDFFAEGFKAHVNLKELNLSKSQSFVEPILIKSLVNTNLISLNLSHNYFNGWNKKPVLSGSLLSLYQLLKDTKTLNKLNLSHTTYERDQNLYPSSGTVPFLIQMTSLYQTSTLTELDLSFTDLRMLSDKDIFPQKLLHVSKKIEKLHCNYTHIEPSFLRGRVLDDLAKNTSLVEFSLEGMDIHQGILDNINKQLEKNRNTKKLEKVKTLQKAIAVSDGNSALPLIAESLELSQQLWEINFDESNKLYADSCLQLAIFYKKNTQFYQAITTLYHISPSEKPTFDIAQSELAECFYSLSANPINEETGLLNEIFAILHAENTNREEAKQVQHRIFYKWTNKTGEFQTPNEVKLEYYLDNNGNDNQLVPLITKLTAVKCEITNTKNKLSQLLGYKIYPMKSEKHSTFNFFKSNNNDSQNVRTLSPLEFFQKLLDENKYPRLQILWDKVKEDYPEQVIESSEEIAGILTEHNKALYQIIETDYSQHLKNTSYSDFN